MSIVYADAFLDGIDLVYKQAAKSAILDTPNVAGRMRVEGKDIYVNTLSLDGAAPYSRSGGFVAGSIANEWVKVEPTYDLGRKFNLDVRDEAEAHIEAGVAAAEYIRTKEAPHIDAIRFNAIASYSGITEVAAPAALTTGAAVLAALKVAVTKLQEDEVDAEGLNLFITPTLLGLARGAANTSTDLDVLGLFENIVAVPQTRFYKGITSYDGTTSGQEAGGFVKTPSTGRDINFLIVHKDAILQVNRHKVDDLIAPELNQSYDAWLMKFRAYGTCDVFPAKVKGVYSHIKNS